MLNIHCFIKAEKRIFVVHMKDCPVIMCSNIIRLKFRKDFRLLMLQVSHGIYKLSVQHFTLVFFTTIQNYWPILCSYVGYGVVHNSTLSSSLQRELIITKKMSRVTSKYGESLFLVVMSINLEMKQDHPRYCCTLNHLCFYAT